MKGARAKAWCLSIHAKAFLSLWPWTWSAAPTALEGARAVHTVEEHGAEIDKDSKHSAVHDIIGRARDCLPISAPHGHGHPLLPSVPIRSSSLTSA